MGEVGLQAAKAWLDGDFKEEGAPQFDVIEDVLHIDTESISDTVVDTK